MDLTQLANLGEFVGGAAVLVTLIYLVIQVRQSNEAARNESVRAFVANWNEQVLAPMADPVTGPLMRRANTSFEDLSGDEKLAAHGIWTSMVFLTHEIFELEAQGKVNEPLKYVGIGAVASYLQAPGPAQWWQSCQAYFDPKHRALLNRAMSGPDSAPPIVDILPWFVLDTAERESRSS